MVGCFQYALSMTEERARSMYDILLLKNNLSIVANCQTPGGSVGNDPLTPLVALCAALQAAIRADGQTGEMETEYLLRLINDPAACRQGEDYLEEHDLEELYVQLPLVLGSDQRRCLMANLLQIMLENGELTGQEQDLIERFREALKLSESQYQEILEGLLLANNMTVYA